MNLQKALLKTARSDNIEFTKLVQLADNTNNGPLLDLRVSLFGNYTTATHNNEPTSETDMMENNEFDGEDQDEFNEILKNIEHRLNRFEAFKKDSTQFLQDHFNTLETLNLFDLLHLKSPTDSQSNELLRPLLSRTYSQPSFQITPTPFEPFHEEPTSLSSSSSFSSGHSSSSSSSGVILRPTREIMAHKDSYRRYNNSQHHSMYINPTDVSVSTRDPFDDRLSEIKQIVRSFECELDEFKDSLRNTEDLVNDVQLEMDDFKNRMEIYIKDIPESHYSALKKLEVDIESILSKRAKNPWLDTGYTLLSYLLTCNVLNSSREKPFFILIFFN
ncbi:MAG: hypothetical protein EXX96DRAFT_569126 [Benjaminiella poitrasii]|nr:MAG: hypothetical protein EXX96DRAFT_569126 [Benjaminiella poitrasii]